MIDRLSLDVDLPSSDVRRIRSIVERALALTADRLILGDSPRETARANPSGAHRHLALAEEDRVEELAEILLDAIASRLEA